jgi:hypothetical protein
MSDEQFVMHRVPPTQAALENRSLIEQAKGMLALAGDLEVEECFEVLRRFARDHNQRLAVVARLLITRELSTAAVIAHARAKRVLPPAEPPAEPPAPRPGPFPTGS